MNTLWFGIAAYLIGSISFAVIVSKVFGLADPRTYGSKNPGATNVLRSGNKVAALVTLIGDGFKGWLAVWLALQYGQQFGVEDKGVALVALAVFLGHLWPLYFKFVGGKGVATFLGVMLGLNVLLGLATMLTWLAVAFAFRYSSLAALLASVFAPLFYLMRFGANDNDTLVTLLAIVAMSALLIYRHRQNISNLLGGKESKIGAKKK
ncbi:MAG TPA: glycerol-3-phosphate 1-O-acyltransferase PlsY [Burkholderiaceae bacterium]|jgi:glycerol-3-phosphate acyltransferase PlsY